MYSQPIKGVIFQGDRTSQLQDYCPSLLVSGKFVSTIREGSQAVICWTDDVALEAARKV